MKKQKQQQDKTMKTSEQMTKFYGSYDAEFKRTKNSEIWQRIHHYDKVTRVR